MTKLLQNPIGRYVALLLVGLVIGGISYKSMAERPYWAYFLVGAIALIPLGLFFFHRRVTDLFGVGCCVLLIAGIWLADKLQVTDREQVFLIAQELVSAVERGDPAAIERHISENFNWQGKKKDYVLTLARDGLTTKNGRTCNIGSPQSESRGDSIFLRSSLYAAGDFGRYNDVPGFFGQLELQFTKERDGKFRLNKIAVRDAGGNAEYHPDR